MNPPDERASFWLGLARVATAMVVIIGLVLTVNGHFVTTAILVWFTFSLWVFAYSDEVARTRGEKAAELSAAIASLLSLSSLTALSATELSRGNASPIYIGGLAVFGPLTGLAALAVVIVIANRRSERGLASKRSEPKEGRSDE